MPKRDPNMKVTAVVVARIPRKVLYCCEDEVADVVRFGELRLSSEISPEQGRVLAERLRGSRLGDMDEILKEVLNAKIGIDIDLGDVTPTS